MPIGSAHVPFASAEDLVIQKMIAGRPRDLEDVRMVLLKNPGLDIGYVRGWLSDFTLTLAEHYASRFESLVASTGQGRT